MSTTLEPDIIRRAVLPHGALVRRQLAAVRRQLRRHLVCEGVAWVIGVAALLIVMSFIVDRWLRLEPGARLALLPMGIGLLVATIYFRLVRPLQLPFADLDLAVIVDRHLPGVGQRVANVLQLPTLLDADPAASPSMIRAAVLQQSRELGQLDLRAPFNGDRFRLLSGAILIPTLILVCAAMLWPNTATIWAKRWMLGSPQRWPQHTYITVVGLDDQNRLHVARGESIVLEVESRPQFAPRAEGWTLPSRGKGLTVWHPSEPRSEIPDEVRIRFRQNGSLKQGVMTQFTNTRFRYELPPVEEPVKFSLTGGDDWLGPIIVEPLDRPGIKDLQLVSQAPGRSEQDTHTFASQESQLLFLPGTKLELLLTSDLPLESASLVSSVGEVPSFQRNDDTHYVARWEMSESQTFEIKLVDAQANLASKPYFISLNLLQDRVPRVTIRSTGVGRRITPLATIPISLKAIDDFGLTAAKIEMEQTVVKEEKPEAELHEVAVTLPNASPTEAPREMDADQRVSLKEYPIAPGNTIRLRGTAADNRAQGTQVGQSRWLTFQVVTPEELFYEILMVQRAQREKFRAALETEKTLSLAFESAIESEELSGLNRTHQVATRQVSQIANRLDATLQEMSLNDLGSTQAREILASGIITPMRELQRTPMASLRGLLDQLAAEPNRSSELVPKATAVSKEVVDSMSRILDRMAQWESFVDVLNQVRQVIQMQNQVLDSTQKTKTERVNSLFDE
jgi:hypothetical protein